MTFFFCMEASVLEPSVFLFECRQLYPVILSLPAPCSWEKHPIYYIIDIIFLRFIYYFFFWRREGKEKERKRNINMWLTLMRPLLGTWPAIQACALTGNQPGDPLVFRLALNPLSHTSQGNIIFYLIIFLKCTLELLEDTCNY